MTQKQGHELGLKYLYIICVCLLTSPRQQDFSCFGLEFKTDADVGDENNHMNVY